jgi:hypothetical protein
VVQVGVLARLGCKALHALAVVFLLLVNVPAFARSARVLLVASGEAELVRKIQAEATHAGIALDGPLEPDRAREAELDGTTGAVGAIHVLSAHRVQIRFAAIDGHEAYETIIERTTADGDGFATRVVEQVRGHFVELRILPAAPVSSPANPRNDAVAPPSIDARSHGATPARSAEVPHGPRMGVSVGASVAAPVGGVGATPGLALGLRIEPSTRWSATAHALLPITENELSEPEGEADLLVNLFLADVGYRVTQASSRWQVELGPGAGMLVLPMEADANPPRTANADRVTSGLVFAHGGLGWLAAPWLSTRATVRAGVVAPRPVVRFGGREVAAWGRGFLATTFDAELTWSLGGGP